MTKTMRKMVDNYKALIDTHKNDFENGCCSTADEYIKVLKDEYETISDTVYGLMRYDIITKEVADEILNECAYYTL